MSESPPKNEIASADAVTPNGASDHQEANGELSPITPPKMSRRAEVEMQRAAKKKQEEDNLRFKPQIAHRKSTQKASDDPDSPAKPEEPAYNRLYSDARKKQEDAKIPPKPEHTFKPNVPQRSNSNVKARAKSPIDTSNRLYQTSARQPRSQEPAGTFKPTISKRAKSLERNPGISTADRLYAQAVMAKEKQEKMREQARQQEDASLTFAPSTNESSKPKEKGKSAPVSARMQSYIEQRNKKIEEARKEKEAREAAEFTGRPSIGNGKKRDSKTTTTSSGANVFDRLTKAAAQPEPEKDPNTYKPTMFTTKRSQSASKAVRRSTGMETSTSSEPIHDRLFKEAEQRRRELAAERDLARQEEEKQLTFTPQISSRVNDGSHEVHQNDSNGTPMSVFKRLNSISKEEIVKKNEKIKQEKELEECTFHPEINVKSSGLFQAAEPVHVRLMKEAERQQQLKKHFADRKAEEELMECTFAPNLGGTESFNARHSGEFGRGTSFTFSEAGDSVVAPSPPKVISRSASKVKSSPAVQSSQAQAPPPVVSPPTVVRAAAAVPTGLAPAPAGLSPAPVGLTPAPVGLTPAPAGLSPAPTGLKPLPAGLSLSPAPTGLKSLPKQPVVATPSGDDN